MVLALLWSSVTTSDKVEQLSLSTELKICGPVSNSVLLDHSFLSPKGRDFVLSLHQFYTFDYFFNRL